MQRGSLFLFCNRACVNGALWLVNTFARRCFSLSNGCALRLQESLKAIHHFSIDHNAPCLPHPPLKKLHNHCFQFLLSITVVPREIDDNKVHYRKWWMMRNSRCKLRLSVTLSPVFFSLSFKASILASCSLTVYCSWPSRSRSSPTCLSSSCTVWCWIPLRTTARTKS